MKKVIFLSLIFLSNWMVMCAQALKQFNIENANNSKEKPIEVSLKKLSKNPKKYHGKVVSVTGFIIMEYEGTAVFKNEKEYLNRQKKQNHRYWLMISTKDLYKLEEECTHKYATITGQFNSTFKGHFEMYNGSIWNIRNIKLN